MHSGEQTVGFSRIIGDDLGVSRKIGSSDFSRPIIGDGLACEVGSLALQPCLP